MDDYRVQLDAYAGPLDLLLYLVKRHEIDLHDIPVAQLTEQYLEHLALIQQIQPDMDVEKAGEFLVMAATLLEIKSQMIMPRSPEEQAEDDDAASEENLDTTDPRYELVQQLLAYKRYKDAARKLERKQDDWANRFPVHPIAKPKKKPTDPETAEKIEIDLEDVNVLDLCEAFSRILSSIGHTGQHEVTYDDTPISLHAEDIYDRLHREGAMSLQKIFEGRRNRSEMIGLFLATLELVRDHKVRVFQDDAGEITLETQPEQEQQADRSEQATDWRDPETGEVQYDWPDEAGKLRAAKRARLRANRAGEELPDFAKEAFAARDAAKAAAKDAGDEDFDEDDDLLEEAEDDEEEFLADEDDFL